MSTATILHDGTTSALEADRHDDDLWVDAAALASATGWVLKPEGLCRGEVCVPVRDRVALVRDDRLGLRAFAAALHRPAVVDADRGVAAIGEAAADIGRRLRNLEAPDFELPDLAGRRHRFSAIGRKKKLLVAWASW